MNARWQTLALAFASLSLGACSSQVDHDYKGEPMMIISGRVESSEVALHSDAVPVLGWYANTMDGEGIGVFAQVEVTGEFPNGFSLRVYEPPPPEAKPGMFSEGRGAAVARILAFRDGAPWSVDGYYGRADWVLGGVGDFLVWYVEEEIPPTPDFRTEDGAPAGLPRGYSLVRLAEWTEEEQVSRHECFDTAERDALARLNEAHGTSFADSIEMPDDVRREYFEYYNELEQECGHKIKMTVIPSGADHPVSLSFDLDNGKSWIDWY